MKVTLGPLPWNWSTTRQNEYYRRVADSPYIDTVYLGQLICGKRPFAPKGIIARLRDAGKEVVLSTCILPRTTDERASVRKISKSDTLPVEANDVTAIAMLGGTPHQIGPYLSISNESTLDFFVKKGATSACLPFDLPEKVITRLAGHATIPLEFQIFGHAPLAISARCFAAYSNGRPRHDCGMPCARNGGKAIPIDTLDGIPFLMANGAQVMSQRCTNLLREIPALENMGISALRIQPEAGVDPSELARLAKAVAHERMAPNEAYAQSSEIAPGLVFCNGFFHNRAGHENIS